MIAVRLFINTSSESIQEHAIAREVGRRRAWLLSRQRFPHRISAQTRS
jgi:hypothetical protein